MKRATFNSIWEAPARIQLSGLYFYGDNGTATPMAGVDPLRDQQWHSSAGHQRTAARRRDAGSTQLVRPSVAAPRGHAPAARVQLASHASITGSSRCSTYSTARNFNAFVTNERSPIYRSPLVDKNVAYQPRVMQLGVPGGLLNKVEKWKSGEVEK